MQVFNSYRNSLPVRRPLKVFLNIKHSSVNENAFAMLVGGGLDLGFRKGIGFRLVQADWLMTKFGNGTQDKQGRVSAGILIKF